MPNQSYSNKLPASRYELRPSSNSLSKISSHKAAVCIISGGIDSLCMAAYLASQGHDLHLLTFNYGQRARIEIQYARSFARMLGARAHKILNIDFMKNIYSNSSVLTDNKSKIPTTFNYTLVVPIRNALFITLAASWAFSIKAQVVAYGAHSGDTHYPDCRPSFAISIARAINLAESDGIRSGIRKKVSIWSPAMEGWSKSDLLKSGYSILGDRVFKSWSCYSEGVSIRGRRSKIHCGVCESCINRKVAFNKAGLEDKTRYAKTTRSGRNK